MNLCPKIQNGRAPLVKTKEDIRLISAWTEKLPSPTYDIWGSYSDEQTEGVWKDFYSNYSFTSVEMFVKGEPNGGRNENCLLLWIYHNGWYEISCNDGIDLNYCACAFDAVPILRLRGLCPESYIDKFYTLYQGTHLGFYGLKQTKIEYDKNKDYWKANVVALSTKGIIRAKSGQSMLLGRHIWNISDDASLCSNGRPYLKVLKLTGCRDDEFTCSDGQCISMNGRCNQIPNCLDESDEIGCSLISIGKNYNKKIPPFQNKRKAQINVSMLFLSINDIR